MATCAAGTIMQGLMEPDVHTRSVECAVPAYELDSASYLVVGATIATIPS